MTLQELITWCEENEVSLDTPIALRDKDDFLLVEGNVSTDSHPYFGNCESGDDYLAEHAPRLQDGEIDYEKGLKFLVLSTGY